MQEEKFLNESEKKNVIEVGNLKNLEKSCVIIELFIQN